MPLSLDFFFNGQKSTMKNNLSHREMTTQASVPSAMRNLS